MSIGLLVPPAAGELPAEARDLYPDVPFVVRGLGVEEMSAADFDRCLALLPDAVADLVAAGAEAISMMGTSISFYLGYAENERLVQRLSELAGGRPASTMASAVLAALAAVSGRARVAVLAAYDDDMTARLRRFLTDAGHEVVSSASLQIRAIDDLDAIGTETLVEAGAALLAEPGVDALIISCGGLRTAGASAVLTERFGVPVISSAVDGIHDAVALLPRP